MRKVALCGDVSSMIYSFKTCKCGGVFVLLYLHRNGSASRIWAFLIGIYRFVVEEKRSGKFFPFFLGAPERENRSGKFFRLSQKLHFYTGDNFPLSSHFEMNQMKIT